MFTVPDTTDQTLRKLVSQGVARNIHGITIPDPTQGILEPEGMTLEEENEIELLLVLANPSLDGDEQAAIARLVSALDPAPAPA